MIFLKQMFYKFNLFFLLLFSLNGLIEAQEYSITSDKIEINTDIDESKIPKTLMYITTHMTQQHIDFLKYCWPLALQNSKLLSSADVMVYLSPNPDKVDESIELLKDVFKGILKS